MKNERTCGGGGKEQEDSPVTIILGTIIHEESGLRRSTDKEDDEGAKHMRDRSVRSQTWLRKSWKRLRVRRWIY